MPDEAPDSKFMVGYSASAGFAETLVAANASLFITAYLANQLICVSAGGGELELSFLHFDRPMGLAAKPGTIAVGGRNHIWTLRDRPELARELDPTGKLDACFVPAASLMTGDIQCHEMAFGPERLALVNTRFSCLCAIDAEQRLIPGWKPPFISELVAEDRCHLNGMALEGGRPAYVTALGETDVAQGWRPGKNSGGCLIETPSGRIIARGFCMPHSPRVSNGRLWLLDSGAGRLLTVDRATGRSRAVARVPGYARGMAIHGGVAFVGLSKIRETSPFLGVPLAEDRAALKCGVAAIDLASGKLRGRLEFTQGIEQIFDVALLPGIRRAALRNAVAL